MNINREGEAITAALYGLDPFGSSRRGGAPSAASGAEDDRPEISIVTPMFDEIGGAAAFVREISDATADRRCEIIVVDDASRDGTAQALADLQTEIRNLRVITHKKNAGQSRAIRTGVIAAKARIIVTLDGDGQNDPADISTLCNALLRADAPLALAMVAGERRTRHDVASRKTASRAANWVRRKLLNDGASDTGCGLKAFYRAAYLRLPYFDHSHRYLPALMRREGFDVEFVGVGHRPRAHGASKYTNLGRLAVAFRDLQGVMWLNARLNSPQAISEVQTRAGYATINQDRMPRGAALEESGE